MNLVVAADASFDDWIHSKVDADLTVHESDLIFPSYLYSDGCSDDCQVIDTGFPVQPLSDSKCPYPLQLAAVETH